jgi:hypothetical protein
MEELPAAFTDLSACCRISVIEAISCIRLIARDVLDTTPQRAGCRQPSGRRYAATGFWGGQWF